MLHISKYHGCGNDFIITEESQLDGRDLSSLIPAVCDRNSGIGADGFIVVRRSPLEMIFYNRDGSRAPMCGNGLRCFARFCYDERIVCWSSYTVETLAGPMEVKILETSPFTVELSMGRPDYRPQALGLQLPAAPSDGISAPAPCPEGPLWGHSLELDGEPLLLYSFFMATDHTVHFCRDPEDPALLRKAERLSSHPFFPRQINVDLVRVIDENTIALRTWERGAGPTLACGTGACAAALAAFKTHHCNNDVTVLLPKGRLQIIIGQDEEVFLRGPAERIMKGVYYDY
ncbi:MAG: diaminopimelate epimerase [Bacillota bacterium]|nr:diaminopimelate epimerase [Bacillota bacterium]